MQLGTPFDALSQALASACYKDLPDIVYQRKDYHASKVHNREVYIQESRRPEQWEVEVVMFPQTWSDTSLGFGGMAGQAFTPAYTVIITHDMSNYCVYFGGRFAYRVNLPEVTAKGLKNFRDDMAQHRMDDVNSSYIRYERKGNATPTQKSPENGSPQDRF